MKLGVVKTIQKEELSKYGDLPGWVDPLLTTLNSFIEQVGKAVQGNLTFDDNFLSKSKRLKFQHGVELTINPESGNLRAFGVLPVSSDLKIDAFGWVMKNDGKVGVTFEFIGGTESNCELLILLR